MKREKGFRLGLQEETSLGFYAIYIGVILGLYWDNGK